MAIRFEDSTRTSPELSDAIVGDLVDLSAVLAAMSGIEVVVPRSVRVSDPAETADRRSPD